MINNLLIYLVNASLATALLGTSFKLFFERLTFFPWNRWYLVVGIMVCVLLPLLPLPDFLPRLQGEQQLVQREFLRGFLITFSDSTTGMEMVGNEGEVSEIPWMQILAILLAVVYGAGVFYKTISFYNSLRFLVNLKKQCLEIERGSFYCVYQQNRLPSFSFGKDIFINTDGLGPAELEQVLLHEKTHVLQRHTVDVLLFEIVRIVLWFNPLVIYLFRSLKQVHEYIVDSEVVFSLHSKAEYGRLLVKLATRQSFSTLIHTFSGSPVYDRIMMLTKPKSSPMQKLKFFSVLPLLAIIITVSLILDACQSSTDGLSGNHVQVKDPASSDIKIGRIHWDGNTKYSAEELNALAGFKAGDRYDSTDFDSRLQFLPDGKDIASVYMNEGYLFFRVETEENFRGNEVDLNLRIHEGTKAKIGQVRIIGNRKVSTDKILRLIDVKPGDLFSRSALISSQKKLAEMGAFDPKNVMINPVPDLKSFENSEFGHVDMEFILSEL